MHCRVAVTLSTTWILLAVGWLVACRWRNRALSAANDVILFSFGPLLVAPGVRTTLSGTEGVVVIAAKVSPMQEFCMLVTLKTRDLG
jgi:hypothetical protein